MAIEGERAVCCVKGSAPDYTNMKTKIDSDFPLRTRKDDKQTKGENKETFHDQQPTTFLATPGMNSRTQASRECGAGLGHSAGTSQGQRGARESEGTEARQGKEPKMKGAAAA